jgi:hypothetical protein
MVTSVEVVATMTGFVEGTNVSWVKKAFFTIQSCEFDEKRCERRTALGGALSHC